MVEAFGTAAPYAEPLWYSRGLTPYYNDSHKRLRQEAWAYVDKFIAPFCEQWVREGKIFEEVRGPKPSDF